MYFGLRISFVVVYIICWIIVEGRIFERCEFAYELTREGIGANNWTEQIPKWLCIAHHATGFDTSFYAEELPVKSYGPLKISNTWCDDGDGSANRCGVVCSELQNDNITETVRCANQIFQGSFSPWDPTWETICKDQDATPYITNCSDEIIFTSLGGTIQVPSDAENFEIPCSVIGYPRPNVVWEWDSQEEDEHIKWNSTGDPDPTTEIQYFAYLYLNNVSESDDSKQFTCRATNADGENVTKTFNIEIVHDDPTTTEESTTVSEVQTSESDTSSPSTEPSTNDSTYSTTDPTTETTTSEVQTTPGLISTETDESLTPTGTTTSVSSTISTTPPSSSTSSTISRRPTMNPIIPTTPSGPPIIYTSCELARKLTNLFNDTYEWKGDLEKWVCLSEVEASFNGSYLEFSPVDEKLVYYGVFKISNRWCADGYNSPTNPCALSCNDLFLPNLQACVTCSQYIHGQMGFSEWPNFVAQCPNITSDILEECNERPMFVSSDDSGTDKVFKEFDLNENISCSAQGFPPPRIWWDVETTKYIDDSGGRVMQVEIERSEESNGNWTIRSTIQFSEVWTTDEREYLCFAENIVGTICQTILVTVVSDRSSVSNRGLIIGGSILLGLLGLFAIPITYAIYRVQKKRNANLLRIYEQFKYGSDGTNSTTSTDIGSDYLSHLPDPEYETYQKILQLPFSKALEILPHRLQIQESIILGSGAFGIVFKGVLDEQMVVAVKTVAKGADESKLDALLSEVKIMSYVGKHPNIVQLLGVQIMDLRKGIAFVAVEFCSRGSMEDVLHAKRRELANAPKYIGIGANNYTMPGYLDIVTIAKPFSTFQLLKFSHQVCSAMEFLTSKRIIHGDLAARNVLLDANFVAKISDFGLSRHIYDNYKSYVVATKETALPWRWLAIETLKDLKFSSESDAWAFGVFVWEVFSLAELPYTAGISWGPEFVKYLERGFRLEMPEYATQEIYHLMRLCWDAEPLRRANFQQLSIKLLSLIESEYKQKQ